MSRRRGVLLLMRISKALIPVLHMTISPLGLLPQRHKAHRGISIPQAIPEDPNRIIAQNIPKAPKERRGKEIDVTTMLVENPAETRSHQSAAKIHNTTATSCWRKASGKDKQVHGDSVWGNRVTDGADARSKLDPLSAY